MDASEVKAACERVGNLTVPAEADDRAGFCVGLRRSGLRRLTPHGDPRHPVAAFDGCASGAAVIDNDDDGSGAPG